MHRQAGVSRRVLTPRAAVPAAPPLCRTMTAAGAAGRQGLHDAQEAGNHSQHDAAHWPLAFRGAAAARRQGCCQQSLPVAAPAAQQCVPAQPTCSSRASLPMSGTAASRLGSWPIRRVRTKLSCRGQQGRAGTSLAATAAGWPDEGSWWVQCTRGYERGAPGGTFSRCRPQPAPAHTRLSCRRSTQRTLILCRPTRGHACPNAAPPARS